VVLRRIFRVLYLSFLCAACAAIPATAAEDPKMKLLFVGVAPEDGAPGPLPPNLPVIAFPDLPTEAAAEQEVFAAQLRSNPVSTFASEPNASNGAFEQFFLVTDLTLEKGENGYALSLGDTSYGLDEYAARMSSVIDAFNPKNRRVGFVRLTDAADDFPMAMADLRRSFNTIGFDMMVLMIDSGAEASCTVAPQSLHFSLVSGLADRAPFGNDDKVSTVSEVEAFLTQALSRQVERDPACGPKYSLIIKSSEDPNQALVTHNGKSMFADMETQLYHETFEAMFLMESDNKDAVHAFLEQCVYCPNETALNDHLIEMEEFARASTLEAEIWDTIKDDETRARLAIYLENCTLCSFTEEATAKIEVIDAKAAAFAREEQEYMAAAEARDLEALRAYVDGCIACTHKDTAAKLVTEIEADEEYMAERAALQAALTKRGTAAKMAYLDSCKVCDGREEIAAALEVEKQRDELSQPCLQLAGVPQLGGPRKLEEIDTAKAIPACEAVAKEFPEDGLIRTTLGRIAQASGNFEAAKAAYAFGIEDDVPSAFGLAAYSHYAPPEGGRVDLDEAEALAVKGAEMGDWLSQEILTVIYSKDLIDGKTAEDAFQIASNIAEEGNALAQFFVGYYYLTGTGVAQSEDNAAAWLGKSVEQGYTHAYSFLAELHEEGRGTEQLPEKAADLYWAALVQGDPTATDRLTTQLGNREREVIRIIQQKLRDEGVYRGTVDGIAGPSTVSAVRRYAESLTEAEEEAEPS